MLSGANCKSVRQIYSCYCIENISLCLASTPAGKFVLARLTVVQYVKVEGKCLSNNPRRLKLIDGCETEGTQFLRGSPIVDI